MNGWVVAMLIAAAWIVVGSVVAYVWLLGLMRAHERAERANLDNELRELIEHGS